MYQMASDQPRTCFVQTSAIDVGDHILLLDFILYRKNVNFENTLDTNYKLFVSRKNQLMLYMGG